jgi:uncharacterized protein involved in exopolysaccharide biosynthesis
MHAMTQTVAPPPDPRQPSRDLTFPDIVGFSWRHWILIFGATVLAGLGTALVLVLAIEPSFEASATLVIVPPKFSSDLKPQALTVQSYQRVMVSDAVVAETKKRLVAKGSLQVHEPLRVGKEIEARIFVSSRAEETALAPMLLAVARGATPERAAAVANTWTAAFLEAMRDLVAGTTASAVQLIDEEYPRARENLTALEGSRASEADALQNRYNDIATTWDDRITAFKNETTKLVSTYLAETRRLQEEFGSEHNLESRRAQLKALRKAYSDLQDEQARVASQLQLKELQLEAARKQLAATMPLVTLRKAITDDALWRSVGGVKDRRVDWKALQERSLTTEEVNPVYTSLNAKVAEIEMDVNAMVPRAATLGKDLQRIDGEMKALEAILAADEAALEKLQRERESGLAQLRETQATRLSGLERTREAALDAIKRETDAKLARLDRDISQQRDFFNQLAKNYNQALLAKAQERVLDIRLLAAAVPPDRAEPRGIARKSVLAAILGALVGIFVALVRDALHPPGVQS